MSDYWTENNIDKPAQRVVCAANRNKDNGRIICGARHWDKVMHSQRPDIMKEPTFRWEQGFIDQFGDFLTREQAWDIAVAQGQIFRLCYEGQKGYLYSENLY